MTKQNAKAVYSSPVLEELEASFGQVLCASEGVTTEQYGDLTDYQW